VKRICCYSHNITIYFEEVRLRLRSQVHAPFPLCSEGYTTHVHIRDSQARESKDRDRDDMSLIRSSKAIRVQEPGNKVARSEASDVVFVAFGLYLREPPDCEIPSEKIICTSDSILRRNTNIIKSVHARDAHLPDPWARKALEERPQRSQFVDIMVSCIGCHSARPRYRWHPGVHLKKHPGFLTCISHILCTISDSTNEKSGYWEDESGFRSLFGRSAALVNESDFTNPR
jgi:hypothetical protein